MAFPAQALPHAPNQLSTETMTFWSRCCGTTLLLPGEIDVGFIRFRILRLHTARVPGEQDTSLITGQRAVFERIGAEFMHDEAERNH